MNVHGRCHCGAIEFDAEIEPSRVTICHCTDCQILTGTAYRTTVRAATDSFVLHKGAPRIYRKTGDNGRVREHGFCDTCGTPIFTRAVEPSPTFGLRIGCLDARPQLRPAQRIWSTGHRHVAIPKRSRSSRTRWLRSTVSAPTARSNSNSVVSL